MSGEAVWVVNALLQKSDHILRNCRHKLGKIGGCGTAAACDQKALLFSIKSFQESEQIHWVGSGFPYHMLLAETPRQTGGAIRRAQHFKGVLREPLVHLGHITLFACRPENTEICPPRISRYSLSWLDTASINPLAAPWRHDIVLRSSHHQ